jgi:hypothetical protein
LNSNFSAIQNSKTHGFKDCILSIGCFQWLSTVINLTLQGQNLSCRLSVLDKSDNWSKLSVNSESGSYNYQESIIPCKFHFPYECSIKLGVRQFFFKIQVLSWMYLLYACCMKLGVYNFIKNRAPSCMYVFYACCIKLGVYNFIKNRAPSCMYVLYACCIKLGVYNFIKNRVLSCMYVFYACCIKLGVYNFIKNRVPSCICMYYVHAASNWVSTILSNSFNLQHTALLMSDWKN